MLVNAAVSSRVRRQHVHPVWSRAWSQGQGKGHLQVFQHVVLQVVQGRRRVRWLAVSYFRGLSNRRIGRTRSQRKSV